MKVTVMVCDRCGVTLAEEPEYGRFHVSHCSTLEGRGGPAAVAYPKIDLCRQCTKDFAEWLAFARNGGSPARSQGVRAEEDTQTCTH